MGQGSSKARENPPVRYNPGIRHGPSNNPTRSVFLDTWGSTGVSPISMHQVILVTNASTTVVSSRTEGTIIDWGARVGNQWVKQGVSAKQKRFDFSKENAHGNTFHYVGETRWTNSQIQSLATKLGYKYSVQHNNCRHVASDTIQAITKIPDLGGGNANDEIERIAATVLEDRGKMAAYMRDKEQFVGAVLPPGSFIEPGTLAADISAQANLQVLDPLAFGSANLRYQQP